MHIYSFKSESEPNVYGFTADKGDAALPTSLGPWKSSDDYDACRGQGIAGIGSADDILDVIETSGAYVAKSGGVTVQRSSVLYRPH